MNRQDFLRELRYITKVYLYLPITFLRRVALGRDPYFRQFFFNRWGFLPRPLKDLARRRDTLWIEALSGGENTQIITFLKRLRGLYPHLNLVLSTNNRYSFNFSKKRPELDFVFDSPWDLRSVVRRTLRRLRPKALLFIENMSYPVLAREAQRRGVKTVLLSGFMSKRFDEHEIMARSIPRRFYRHLDHIGVKGPEDADGYRRLGADPKRIRTVGEMKYDLEYLRLSEEANLSLRRDLGIERRAPVLVAGGVRAGEDDIILEAYRRLKSHHPDFRLLLAPSHYSNTLQVNALFRSHGFPYRKRTEAASQEDTVILVDTFGELGHLYGIGSFNFIGASIIPKGRLAYGHNIIEPLAHGQPIFFGPHMNHWRAITKVLLTIYPGLEVRTGEELAQGILGLVGRPNLMARLKEAAEALVEKHRSAVAQNLAFVQEILSRQGIEARRGPAEAPLVRET